ncbi:MAG: hypothetical protein GEU86_18345 [Actinophytocola sp.]|nr:hypothetical protein [Actinophytocola sp.]
MRTPFVSRVLLAATFTGVRTPDVKALGVLEVWFLYQAARPDVVQLAVPGLRRGWGIPRAALAAGVFRPTATDTGVSIAPGPRRVRVLLPAERGRVGLYTPREKLLAAICDTATVVPFDHNDPAADRVELSAGWSR